MSRYTGRSLRIDSHCSGNEKLSMATKGFTLIELMIVVTIVGILAAIAYPSYQNQVRQTRRTDAQIALNEIANLQEKFYSNCSGYATALGTGSISACDGLGYKTVSSDGNYALTLTAGNGKDGNGVDYACPTSSSCGYNIVADPDGAAANKKQSKDGKLRINAIGIKTWDKNNDGKYCCKWSDK